MKKSTMARLVGGGMLIGMLIVIGALDIVGPWVLVLTLGFSWAFEWLVIKPLKRSESTPI